jgi:glycosyltransferase involved in cell wall biosynthesis
VRAWFWANERIAGLAAHHLIADHPGVYEHLTRHTPGARITMLPYGADAVGAADEAPLRAFDLTPRAYALLVARAEPENSMLEIVRAYSRLDRPEPLLVVGRVEGEGGSAYQRAVRAAAGDRVRFAGPVYDREILASLRFHCGVYLHGHRVGGTNPSLVEALGAGAAVVAHDNPFNRWVAGAAGEYFRDEDELVARIRSLLAVPQKLAAMRAASRIRHAEAFQWEAVLAGYERLLDRWQQREVGALEVPPQSVRRVDP